MLNATNGEVEMSEPQDMLRSGKVVVVNSVENSMDFITLFCFRMAASQNHHTTIITNRLV